MSLRILCTGAFGFLGSALRKAAASFPSVEFRGLSHAELDIGDAEQIQRGLLRYQPHILLNAAAYREVDKAEVERDAARLANGTGPRLLAEACLRHGIKLVHFSTHGVFDGKKAGPYVESDPALPLNHYAVTKLEGEAAIDKTLPLEQRLILRISWPYAARANNFIGAILAAAKIKDEISVVADQVATPTPVDLIAHRTFALIQEGKGLFHLSCRGSCSRFELMQKIFGRLGLSCRLIPVGASAFPTLAARPANMALATELAWMDDIAPMPSWEEALEDFLRSNPLN